MKCLSLFFCALALVAPLSCVAAENTGPAPGPVVLAVSLPDPGQKLLYVHEVMPVTPGPLTLYYPKWIPGDHSPDGPINDVMGLEFSANGKRISKLCSGRRSKRFAVDGVIPGRPGPT